MRHRLEKLPDFLPETWRPRFTASKAFSLAVFMREDKMREDKMMNESPNNQTIKELWQCQPVEGMKMSVEEIRTRATKFERKIMWRNVREYVAGGIAAGLFASFLVKSHDTFFQTACALMIAGLACMAYQLHRRASARSMPSDL